MTKSLKCLAPLHRSAGQVCADPWKSITTCQNREQWDYLPPRQDDPNWRSYNFNSETGNYLINACEYINEFGLRGLLTKKRSRMLCVGCSFTAGIFLPEPETLSWSIEKRLRNWTVLNCGGPNFGTYCHLLRVDLYKRTAPQFVVFQVMQPIRNPSLYFTEREFGRASNLELKSAKGFSQYELNHRFTKAGRRALYLYHDIRNVSSYLADKVFDYAVRKDIKYMRRFFAELKVPYLLHMNTHTYPFYKEKHIQRLRDNFEHVLVYDVPVGLDYCRSEADNHPNGLRNDLIAAEIIRYLAENFPRLDCGIDE
jgi:hypothetical protein